MEMNHSAKAGKGLEYAVCELLSHLGGALFSTFGEQGIM
jgi:hypothetical protein